MNKISKQLIKIARMLLSYRMQLNNEKKKDLEKYIESIKQNKDVSRSLENFFYSLLTKGGLTRQQVTNSFNSFSEQQRKKYQKYIERIFPINNGAWAQINFNKNLSTKQNNKTFNYYVNLQFKNKDDVNNFVNSIYKLMQAVKQLSDSLKCYIGFKTHATLTALLNHNDTIKFYWYDNSKNIQEQIKRLVNKYVSSAKLTSGNRLYDSGSDVNGASFGERCAKELSTVFIKWINDNKNAYTTQQFLQSFEKYLDSWIKSISKKLK